MKTNRLFPCLPALILAGVIATFSFGCKKKSAPPYVATPAVGTQTAAVVSSEKTSFTEVTSQLDPGGNFYVYLGTAQWLDGLSAKVGDWRKTFTSMPDLKKADAANINKAFDIAVRLIKDSGIEDVSGVGMSSVELEKGMFRNKALLHHYPGKGDGFLWQIAGKGPHPLTGLDLLPADTALAVFTDADVPALWKAVEMEVGKSDVAQAQQWLQKFPAQFEKQTQLKWDAVLDSLGGEFGMVVTLDPSSDIAVPVADASLTIPTPGLLIAVKVNDDTIFNRIDKELKSNAKVVSVNQSGLKMRTLPMPIPFVGELRPSTASSGGYLFVASSDELINDALAVKSGTKPGLKTTAEFKHLAQGLPQQGNQFSYMSPRFADILMKVQQQAMTNGAGAQPQMAKWMQSIYKSQPAFAYSVGINTPEGCLTVGNGSSSYANMALLPAVAVPGLLAAIAIPNFIQARATSQGNSCINNLRQLDGAKQEWALEKGKKATDVPTKEDLLPYLKSWPVCPQGGTYTINSVADEPTCSIPGHKLP